MVLTVFKLHSILSGFSSFNQHGFMWLSQCFVDNDLCLRHNSQGPPYCTFKKCKILYHSVILFYYWKQKQEISWIQNEQLRMRKIIFFIFPLLITSLMFFLSSGKSEFLTYIFNLSSGKENSFYKAGLLTTNSSSFLCTRKKSLFLFHLKDNVSGYRILSWWVFPLKHFLNSIPLLLAGVWRETRCDSDCWSSIGKVNFPLASFRSFPLFSFPVVQKW